MGEPILSNFVIWPFPSAIRSLQLATEAPRPAERDRAVSSTPQE
jgi:hypothetical protein